MTRGSILFAVLLLGACAGQPHYSLDAPAAPPQRQQPQAPRPHAPADYVKTAGPLTVAGAGHYMDAEEADFRRVLRGQAVIARQGDTLLVTLPVDKLFKAGVLSGDGRGMLLRLSDLLRHYDHTVVQVGSHTDTTGSQQQNMTVSQRRAQAVADALVAGGVASARVSAQGFGATHLKVKTGENIAEPKNRRIELRIVPQAVG